VVAHLCHPRPSANDNASGAGAVMEAARALQALVTAGVLAAPRRTIRFLLVPEMTGTYAYLANDSAAASRTLAAINLDMVGERQDLCGSTLTLERPPRATATFAGDLGAIVLEQLLARGAKNLAGTASYSRFRYAVTPFSGGSDHYILSDPTVGVGCPMLIQWPDRFYHTSLDTLDKVDPQMLALAATLAAVYAYYVATAGLPEAVYLAGEMAASFAAEIHRAAAVGGDWRRRLEFLLERKTADLESLRRLVAPEEQAKLEAVLDNARADLRTAVAMETRRHELAAGAAGPASSVAAAGHGRGVLSGDAELARTLVPVRLVPGPAEPSAVLRQSSPAARDAWYEFQKEHREFGRVAVLGLYWADGHRTVADINDLVELEAGSSDLGYLVHAFEVLAENGVVRLERRPA